MGRALVCRRPVSSEFSLWCAGSAMCAGRMEAWAQKTDVLWEAMVGHLAGVEEPGDYALLEAERQLGEYISRSASGDVSGADSVTQSSLESYLPVPAARASASSPHECPAAAAWQRGQKTFGAPVVAALRCECDPRTLEPSVHALEELVQNRVAQIQELQGELCRVHAVAPPELAALAEDNESLASRVTEGAASIMALQGERSTLSWSLQAGRHLVSDLELERRKILAQLGDLEREEASARDSCQGAEAELAEERQGTREDAIKHELLMEATEERVEDLEREWSEAREMSAAFELQSMEIHADLAERLREASIEADQQFQHLQELEAELCLKESIAAAASTSDQARWAALGSELAQARTQAGQFRSAEGTLATQLIASARRGEETERKALSVARELVDASQGIAWLRAEAATREETRWELQETQKRAGLLQRRVQDLQRESALSVEGDDSFDFLEDLVATFSGRSLDAGRDVLGPAALEQELNEHQSERTSEVNEAFQAAWEEEAREHRTIQRRVGVLQGCLLPVQQQLVRMTEIVSLWRQGLLRSAGVGELREGDRGGGISSGLAQRNLPPPPLEAKWDDAASASAALQALCLCVEALAAETARQVEEAKQLEEAQELHATSSFVAALTSPSHRGAQPVPALQESEATDSDTQVNERARASLAQRLALGEFLPIGSVDARASARALLVERLALEDDLRRLTPKSPALPSKLLATPPSACSLSLGASSMSLETSPDMAGAAAYDVQEGSTPLSQQACEAGDGGEGREWPNSPRPHPRALRAAASRPHFSGGFGGARAQSVASTMSSISLHDGMCRGSSEALRRTIGNDTSSSSEPVVRRHVVAAQREALARAVSDGTSRLPMRHGFEPALRQRTGDPQLEQPPAATRPCVRPLAAAGPPYHLEASLATPGPVRAGGLRATPCAVVPLAAVGQSAPHRGTASQSAELGPVSRRTGQMRQIPKVVGRSVELVSTGQAPLAVRAPPRGALGQAATQSVGTRRSVKAIVDDPSDRFDADSVYRR